MQTDLKTIFDEVPRELKGPSKWVFTKEISMMMLGSKYPLTPRPIYRYMGPKLKCVK